MDALSDPILGSICVSAVVVFSTVPVCVGPPSTEKKNSDGRPRYGGKKKANTRRHQLDWVVNASSLTAASCLILIRGLLQCDLLTESSMALKKCILAGSSNLHPSDAQSQEGVPSRIFFCMYGGIHN